MSESSERAQDHRESARYSISAAERTLNADNWPEGRDLRVQSLALIGIGEALLAIAETLSGVVFVQDAGRE